MGDVVSNDKGIKNQFHVYNCISDNSPDKINLNKTDF